MTDPDPDDNETVTRYICSRCHKLVLDLNDHGCSTGGEPPPPPPPDGMAVPTSGRTMVNMQRENRTIT